MSSSWYTRGTFQAHPGTRKARRGVVASQLRPHQQAAQVEDLAWHRRTAVQRITGLKVSLKVPGPKRSISVAVFFTSPKELAAPRLSLSACLVHRHSSIGQKAAHGLQTQATKAITAITTLQCAFLATLPCEQARA